MAQPFDPFAAAGFGGASAPPPQAEPEGMSAPFDPFGAAGFAQVAPDAPTQTVAKPPRPKVLAVMPDGRPIFDDPALNNKITENNLRIGEKMGEGATFGLLPHIVAGVRSLFGTPYQQGLAEARKFTNDTSEEMPGVSMAAEAMGGLAPGGLIGKAAQFGTAGRVPALAEKAARGAAMGGAFGAANTAGHNVGMGTMDNFAPDLKTAFLVNAGLGGGIPIVGAGLQAGANTGRALVNAFRNAATEGGRGAVAGQILKETMGDFTGTPATSPIPGVTLRPAQATGNPGLASLERTLGPAGATTAEDVVQNGMTPRQTGALIEHLVGPDNAARTPTAIVNEASQRGVGTIRALDAALGGRERELWQDPALANVTFHGPTMAQGVARSVAQLPASWRDAITGPNATLGSFLKELGELGPNATIQEVNSVRSRILAAARDAAAGANPDSVKAQAARSMADAVINQMEQAPAFAAAAQPATTRVVWEPSASIEHFGPARRVVDVPATPSGDAAREAYQRARDFTRQYNTTLGFPEFDPIFTRNYAGNITGNDEAIFGRFFDPRAGTSAGASRLQDLIDFATANGNPNLANQLSGDMQQYLRALVAARGRASTAVDAAGRPAVNVRDLAAAGENLGPVVEKTPALAPAASDLTTAVQTARLLGRPSSVRSDTGSPTYDKLKNDQLIAAILGQSGSSALGMLGGGAAGYRYTPDDAGPLTTAAMTGGGALAGALLGRTFGGKLTSLPLANKVTNWVNEPARKEIEKLLAGGLGSEAELQRLLSLRPHQMPNLSDPGAVSNLADIIARQSLSPSAAAVERLRRRPAEQVR